MKSVFVTSTTPFFVVQLASHSALQDETATLAAAATAAKPIPKLCHQSQVGKTLTLLR